MIQNKVYLDLKKLLTKIRNIYYNISKEQKGGTIMNRFAGVGIVNVAVIVLVTIIVIVGSKAILTRYPVPGLTDIIMSI